MKFGIGVIEWWVLVVFGEVVGALALFARGWRIIFEGR